METPLPPGIRELPIVGGHLALDFANTVDDPEGPARHDHIGTYAALVGWSVRIGVTSPDQEERPEDAAAALRQAHALRQTILETFTDIAAGESAAARHWTELRPYVTEAIGRAQLAPTASGYGLTWPGRNSLLGPVAYAAFELLTGPELHRVKRCAGCPWLFLDQSKNGSRRWCAMNDCGTHAKIQRYVAKRAARRRA
jgi:predicted RNA-binding Zn ribbon-like protein